MYYGKYKVIHNFQTNIYLPYSSKWSRYTLAYEKGKTSVYLDSSLILQLEIPENSFQIGKINYGMILGNVAYIAAARHYGVPLYFDSMRIFSRTIGKGDIF